MDNNDIEEVNHYISCICMNFTSKEQEIKYHIKLGWQDFGRVSTICKNKDIPIMKKIYSQYILPSHLQSKNLKLN